MMLFKSLGVFFLLLCCQFLQAQQLVYSNILYGGVTGNGGSVANGSGTINFPVQIPSNSTIKKVYLIAARDSLADDITVTLNGNNYTFSDVTIITDGFNAFNNGSSNRPNSSIHMLDITSDIDSSVNTYSLTIPPPNNSFKGVYTFYYLYIVYENLFLSKINCNLFLNYKDVAPITTYNLTNLTPINNTNSVSLAINALQFCDTIQDGSYVDVNGNTIGLIGGEDLNSNLWTCVGPWANFAHYNDSLFGLDDDTSDSLMGGTDALADIKSYVNNGDTAVDIVFTYQTLNNSNGGILTNPIRAVMLSYSTPCDTFSTAATATQDTICLGDSVQLSATGGATYSWYGSFGGLSDTSIANPMASPPQTTTYIVTIKNDSGCVKTEHVKIWVIQPIDSISTTPTTCGNATGSITSHFNTNANYNFTLYDNNFNLLSSNITGTFNQLAEGTYIVENILHNCTFYDTVMVNAVNNVTASFYNAPQAPFSNPNQSLGKAPMEVSFMNTSQNANMFAWSIAEIASYLAMTGPKDTLIQHSTFNTQHFFTEGGTFEVCLIAYNNLPQCADTVCKTIFIDNNENVSVLIPNVFTPNGDNENDNFVIQVLGANLLERLEVEVFNRWGQEVGSRKLEVGSLGEIPVFSGMTEVVIWDGTTTSGKKAAEGTYFYVVTYTTKQGETVTEKGSVTLLR